MGEGRLETFIDSVIAIIMLELKVPHGSAWPDVLTVLPVLLSFFYVGIYWVNK
mgnify:CR=1 FL=1